MAGDEITLLTVVLFVWQQNADAWLCRTFAVVLADRRQGIMSGALAVVFPDDAR